jgi:hypothetical protein
MKIWLIAAALCAVVTSASAETRIIRENFSQEAASKFQQHTNQTAHFGVGGSGGAIRQSDTFFWIYQHGIDLVPVGVTISGIPGATADKDASIAGRGSSVFLPISDIGGQIQSAPAGAISIRVNVPRKAVLNDHGTVRVTWPLGNLSFGVDVECQRIETPAKLLSVAIVTTSRDGNGVPRLKANETAQARIVLDSPAKCGGQVFSLFAPKCFQADNQPFGGPRAITYVGRWPQDLRNPANVGVTADASCDTRDIGQLKVSVDGVEMDTPLAFYTPFALQPRTPLPTLAPRIIPKPSEPALPQAGHGPIVPKPKSGGGG